ncbi:MAG: PmbA protein [Planctomycetota bacterium]|jgi:PmbA protein
MAGETMDGVGMSHTEREAQLLEAAKQLVEAAQAKGADQAEAFASGGEMTQVAFEDSDLKQVQMDEFCSVGLRVIVDGRQGFCSTNQLGEASLQQAAEDALALARMAPPDAFNGLPPTVEHGPALDMLSADPLELSLDQTVQSGMELIGRVMARDARLSLDKADVTLSRVSQGLVNSLGAEQAESDAQVSVSVFGMAVDGDDVGGFDYACERTRRQGQLQHCIEETVRTFADGALGNLAAGSAESYEGPVLFAPSAFLSAFVSPLLAAASSMAVQRGRSALEGKLGQQVTNDVLTILDDPHNLELAGAGSFDREGQPTRRFELLKAGVLQGLFYNGYSAQVDGVVSTGHARGGARGVPGLGPHAVHVLGGSGGSSEELTRTLGKGLLVQRFSGSVDPASGDFSGVAKSARWVENGQVVRSVKETLIAGNAFELLRGQLSLSSTPESLMGVSLAPWALVDGLSVTAG